MLTRRELLVRTTAAGLLGGLLPRCGPAFLEIFESNLNNLGPLGPPDVNGLRLPEGFESRVLARSGEEVVAGFTWHQRPDGGATFPCVDGGWIYVSNAEVGDGGGGVGALRFDAAGEIINAYPILSGTTRNCAGGPTPWGTWLSCEEFAAGQVWECDPLGGDAVVREALGNFRHEAVAVDDIRGQLYLTEDEPDGRFYRFTPDEPLPYLGSGRLEALRVLEGDTGPVTWETVEDVSDVPVRQQVPDATLFFGGEGIWYHDGVVYFSTKLDGRVWALDIASQSLSVLYDQLTANPATLTGLDNVTVNLGGDVVVAEDGGDMQLVALTRQGGVVPMVQIVGQDGSEVTGPAFSPDYRRIYFSSQRDPGTTYEVLGPFITPKA